jgi:primase-polymerase (primpol)-like protein
VGDGLGFALNGDGIVCIDLDHCINEVGVLSPAAACIMAFLPKTYVEVSPSGTGLHIWGRASRQPAMVSKGVEFYATGRYMTVTGKPWRDAPAILADISATVDQISRR